MGTHGKIVCLGQLKAGDTIVLDGGFDCANAGPVKVEADAAGELFFRCSDGEHYLAGQLGWDEEEAHHAELIGIVGHTPAAEGLHE